MPRPAAGPVEVLRGVGFTVGRGEVIALLGPNGAGKNTTIEIHEGFRLPSAGSVAVLGVDPARGDEAWRARLGVVLQSWRDHRRSRVPISSCILARHPAALRHHPAAEPDLLRGLGVLAFGTLATMPWGPILGSVARGPRGVSTWAMLLVIGLLVISGVFYPISAMAGWVRVIAQIFPMYWLGLGMRSAFLPDEAAAI